MKRNRLEAFSDGVLAIIITIMVLELKVPHLNQPEELFNLIPVFLSYVLSFIYIGIYWNNHHHLIHTIEKVNGSILWANLHLLFWLSLLPFATGLLGENHISSTTVIIYNSILFFAAIAYYILQIVIVKYNGKDSLLAKALGKDYKGKLSVILYLLSIPLAFLSNWLSLGISIIVAIIWLIPDKRIENTITNINL